MAKPVQQQRFQIPTVIDPPKSVCLTIQVPDDPIHIANVIGALYQVAFGPNYENDDAHSAKDIVQVWRRYWSTLKIEDCPPDILTHGGLLEDFKMPLRVDCDCNVWVTCCDGTEKQLLTADQVNKLIVGQPGKGAPQPAPGGCVVYQGDLQANNRYYISAPVNAGDTVSILSADGLTNDGATAVWRDWRGHQIFAGLDVGFVTHSGGDLVPTAPHLGLLINVNGTYYDCTAPFTVPGGVVNGTAFLAINCTTLALMGGDIQLQVQVCNNQVGTYTHVFDFTLDPHSAFVSPRTDLNAGHAPSGVWVAGLGYQTTYSQLIVGHPYDYFRQVAIQMATGVSHAYTSSTWEFTYTAGSYNGDVADRTAGIDTAIAILVQTMMPTVPVSPMIATGFATQVTAVQLITGANTVNADPGGQATITKATITGNGIDPFI